MGTGHLKITIFLYLLNNDVNYVIVLIYLYLGHLEMLGTLIPVILVPVL